MYYLAGRFIHFSCRERLDVFFVSLLAAWGGVHAALYFLYVSG